MSKLIKNIIVKFLHQRDHNQGKTDENRVPFTPKLNIFGWKEIEPFPIQRFLVSMVKTELALMKCLLVKVHGSKTFRDAAPS